MHQRELYLEPLRPAAEGQGVTKTVMGWEHLLVYEWRTNEVQCNGIDDTWAMLPPITTPARLPEITKPLVVVCTRVGIDM